MYECTATPTPHYLSQIEKLVLVSQEPLLYLAFNKPDKENVYEINLYEKFNFFSHKITVDTLIDVRNETSKHHVKINTQA